MKADYKIKNIMRQWKKEVFGDKDNKKFNGFYIFCFNCVYENKEQPAEGESAENNKNYKINVYSNYPGQVIGFKGKTIFKYRDMLKEIDSNITKVNIVEVEY